MCMPLIFANCQFIIHLQMPHFQMLNLVVHLCQIFFFQQAIPMFLVIFEGAIVSKGRDMSEHFCVILQSITRWSL